MDMVERVARALCDDTMSRWRSPVAMKAEPWREFVPAARAAIEAMREPTPEMIEAGYFDYTPDPLPTDGVWKAMIDAALSPSGEK